MLVLFVSRIVSMGFGGLCGFEDLYCFLFLVVNIYLEWLNFFCILLDMLMNWNWSFLLMYFFNLVLSLMSERSFVMLMKLYWVKFSMMW